MEFADDERTTLRRLGQFPPRIRAITGKIGIRHKTTGMLRVWAVDQAGKRIAEISPKADAAFLRFAIDNVIPGHGPVTYFEVSAK
jgi:hypothetical protein